VLAALLLARVAREKSGLLQRRAGVRIQRDERSRDAEPDRAGLAADPAAVERRLDVVDLFGLRQPQRLLGDDLMGEDREIGREGATVDRDLAGAVAHPNARDRFFATAGRLDQGLGQIVSFELGVRRWYA